MRAEFAHEQAQTYLRQRNRFAVLAGVLGLTTLISLGAAVSLPSTTLADYSDRSL